MLHVTLILEDTLLVLTNEEGGWNGHVSDAMTGRSAKVQFTDEETNAILALAVHPDGQPLDEDVTRRFYDIAEPAMERNGIKESEFCIIS
jgi:hypothetical protein